MSERIVLHIGAMKTGTTFLQTTLERNNELLAAADLDFVGGRFAYQTRAVSTLLKGRPQDPQRLKRWRQLARAARASEQGASVVSMEFLSFANDRQVAELLRPLRRSHVEVVMTVRDQLLAAPAQWQTYCRNKGRADWAGYLRHIEPGKLGTHRRSDAFRTFHRAQDVDRILRRWAARPEVSAVHVVTVPGRGAPRDELWNRFFDALGTTPPAVDFGVAAPNTSLGYGSCDLLRRLNHHLGDVRGRPYRQGMRKLAREVLAPRRDQESRPTLDRRAADYARRRNEQLREMITESGFVLHGHLDDLPVPDDLDRFDAAPPAVPKEESLASARAAWTYLADRAGQTGRAPRGLDALVAQDAKLLRLVNGW